MFRIYGEITSPRGHPGVTGSITPSTYLQSTFNPVKNVAIYWVPLCVPAVVCVDPCAVCLWASECIWEPLSYCLCVWRVWYVSVCFWKFNVFMCLCCDILSAFMSSCCCVCLWVCVLGVCRILSVSESLLVCCVCLVWLCVFWESYKCVYG